MNDTRNRKPLSERKRKSFWLSVNAYIAITKLARALGIGRTAVIELAVRELAKKENIST